MTPPPLTLSLASPEATADLARRLGALLHPGDSLLLEGDIGAGKTHFARALIQSLLPVPEDVPSPTFTLVQTYEGAPGEIWHADLYRLSDIGEIEELGLTQAMEEAICLIEWPDRLGDLAPPTALRLHFAAVADSEDARLLTLDWTGSGWATRLAPLQETFQ
ncbi:tRNA (adenosine(37)-N6)-threonylcarbamoyltransferase complex ATPase subunit type 1 TsaE [Pseudodonghicola flavimaris]|uniref:tRNA threonylcarbamoyladenosine biosynthesis protein TsaE n=1 Tax=Pseudodonghicola flavimaris TaxID=3050036 RepID=A0ABT7EZQ7_9RHOB|nr:tRNA (adenosine(37)-N6)-threonylcarbamoyltransferase complex ATPase subunit type 1 TsaE [Pseudodonghicola flavimaris]MDK3017833.1 tRNA (adenosine(37)-N6)-threonylcarbamoyltransferase complex ATPase subunit type 1 TsaE [Pseudodonghicola flavimaris]